MVRTHEGSQSPSETFLDIAGAADILKLRTSTLYKLTSQRRIPHFKKGGKLFFDRDELHAWVLEGRRDVISQQNAETHLRTIRGGRS